MIQEGLIKSGGRRLVSKFSQLWQLVGNTPMLEIHYSYKGARKSIFAKCEHYNLTGSIKDRMALYILHRSYAEGKIEKENRIVEATSGNTGISFAAIGRALGHAVTIIMPDWLSLERTAIIKSFAAEIIPVSAEENGFIGCIARAQQMSLADPNIFLPRQFENEYNSEAHTRTTAPEIWSQLHVIGQRPSAFVAGVGTGGTVMGMAKFFKMKDPAIKIHPLEPAESPTLTMGYKVGSHRIQGISDEFIPPIVDLKRLDDVISVHDGDAIIMAQMMAKQLGIAVGISSGANILGAIKVKEMMGRDAVVVTVLPDSNKKYLSTDLMKSEISLPHYLSNEVELVDYVPVGRRYALP